VEVLDIQGEDLTEPHRRGAAQEQDRAVAEILGPRYRWPTIWRSSTTARGWACRIGATPRIRRSPRRTRRARKSAVGVREPLLGVPVGEFGAVAVEGGEVDACLGALGQGRGERLWRGRRHSPRAAHPGRHSRWLASHSRTSEIAYLRCRPTWIARDRGQSAASRRSS
jgi:hypothetical protein